MLCNYKTKQQKKRNEEDQKFQKKDIHLPEQSVQLDNALNPLVHLEHAKSLPCIVSPPNPFTQAHAGATPPTLQLHVPWPEQCIGQ